MRVRQVGRGRTNLKLLCTLDVLRIGRLSYFMIRGYRDTRSRRFADGERVPAFEGFRRRAEKRLRILEAASSLRDLAQLPGNRLEALSGNRG